MPLIEGAIYEHVKTGTKYRLLAVAKETKELGEYVVYEALYDNPVSKYWIRTKEEFIGTAVRPDGTPHPRFRLVSEE